MSIEIRDISLSYGDQKVLRNVSLKLECAKELSILGPNGAGKTTLLSAVAGLLPIDSGEIVYEGVSRKQIKPRGLAKLIGYVPQTISPAFDYSVLDYVVTGCAPQLGSFERPRREHYDAAMEAICEMGIERLAEKSYRQISGGERQQVCIARAIAQKPSFILLDEPTAHLDFGNQIHVLKTIRRLTGDGYGVVFTTHNPDHVLLLDGDTAVINREGSLVFGNSKEIMDEDYLSKLYGARLCIEESLGAGRKVCFAPGL